MASVFCLPVSLSYTLSTLFGFASLSLLQYDLRAYHPYLSLQLLILDMLTIITHKPSRLRIDIF